MTRLSVEERFWSKVDKTAPGGCWRWTAARGDGGYGSFWDGRDVRAHRWAYLMLVGPIPDGYQLDHLCHTRASNCSLTTDCPHRRCVNPKHLEAVTPRENLLRSNCPSALNARKTECPKGHLYVEANTYRKKNGFRRCRTCISDDGRRKRALVRELLQRFPGELLPTEA